MLVPWESRVPLRRYPLELGIPRLETQDCARFWVFASPKMHGKQPYWPETVLRCYVRPAAKRLGIAREQIDWRSFPRTFATLLKGSGEDAKTVQELMLWVPENLSQQFRKFWYGLYPLARSPPG